MEHKEGHIHLLRFRYKKKKGNSIKESEKQKLRVAAYARVSTDCDEQATSYDTQVDHYTNYIKKNPDWEFAGVFSDEGISGTYTKKRAGFNKMIEEAMEGNVDYIITKSISSFARNTLDCLKYIRKLKENNIPVYFEKENINTMDAKGGKSSLPLCHLLLNRKASPYLKMLS